MAKQISSLDDILRRKADDIDSSGVRDDVHLIQEELDRQFDSQAKVEQLQDKGVVVVKTRNSSIASELRLKQYAILQNLNKSAKNQLNRFRIIIG